jgi:hypothetical protein
MRLECVALRFSSHIMDVAAAAEPAAAVPERFFPRTKKVKTAKKSKGDADAEAPADAAASLDGAVQQLWAKAVEEEVLRHEVDLKALGYATSIVGNAAVIAHLQRNTAIVKRPADMDGFDKVGRLFSARSEFVLSPLFSPDMVDASCQHGAFPLAIDVSGEGFFFFAPKLHKKRAIVDIGPKMVLPAGVGKQSKRFVAAFNVCYDAVIAMINMQHGDNWLCPALRIALKAMFLQPDAHRTKIFTVALFDRAALARATESGEGTAASRLAEAMVSCELGYVIGDMYTSMTGAYTVDGTGSLQLAVLGAALLRQGYRRWDLGQWLKYKQDALQVRMVDRAAWLKVVEEHRAVEPTGTVGTAGLACELARSPVSCKALLDDFHALSA